VLPALQTKFLQAKSGHARAPLLSRQFYSIRLTIKICADTDNNDTTDMPSHSSSNKASSSSRDNAGDGKNHGTKNALGTPQIINNTIAYCVFVLETAATSPVLHSKLCENAPQGPCVFQKIL
jgi:hypothetical protein